MDFQRVQGCQAITQLSVAQNATHTSRMAGDFQSCVAQVIHQQIVNNSNNAEMYSVSVDESTDISICKQIRIVDQNFIPHSYFLKNVTITETKSDATVLFSCFEKSLEENGMPFDKLKGFGSDGWTAQRSGFKSERQKSILYKHPGYGSQI